MRSLMIFTPHQILFGCQIEKNEMGGSCSMYRGRRGVYRVLVGNPERKRLLIRPWHRWEYNIKMDLQEVG
jgi:mRNA-degrading endonuclease RelE of RelBE toxin-antitoxin system